MARIRPIRAEPNFTRGKQSRQGQPINPLILIFRGHPLGTSCGSITEQSIQLLEESVHTAGSAGDHAISLCHCLYHFLLAQLRAEDWWERLRRRVPGHTLHYTTLPYVHRIQ